MALSEIWNKFLIPGPCAKSLGQRLWQNGLKCFCGLRKKVHWLNDAIFLTLWVARIALSSYHRICDQQRFLSPKKIPSRSLRHRFLPSQKPQLLWLRNIFSALRLYNVKLAVSPLMCSFFLFVAVFLFLKKEKYG